MEKRIRVEKRVLKGSGDGKKRMVCIVKAGDGDDAELLDIDDLLSGIEEEDENGHTVLKIRIPKVGTGDGDADPLVRAAGMSGAIDNLESEVGALVRRARSQGYTWTQIGQALGTSKQAAWERFSGED